MSAELFLLSNSRMPGGQPFDWALGYLREAFGGRIRRVALVPFAGVTLSWDEYELYVSGAFAPLGIDVESVHRSTDASALIHKSDAVFVGGGNSFHLTHHLHETGLMPVIREVCVAGKPYMGWSAGANVACPTMRTTNDMPIIQPASFETLGLVPFQINPHYTNVSLPGHGGESRDQRIEEFVSVNPNVKVVGLPEGALLHRKDGSLKGFGMGMVRVFSFNATEDRSIDAGFSDLLSA